MTWWPTFLNLWPAVLAAAIAVPLLILLYFLKLRRKDFSVASTLLWKKAIQDLQVNAPFQRLRRNLLLLLQLLLLAALLLALARPIASFAQSAGKRSVIVIDDSASMAAADVDGHSRLEQAKRQAKDLIDTMGRGAAAMLIAADDHARIVQPWTTDAAALRVAIDQISQTDRLSRLKEAYQLAEAQSTSTSENQTTKTPADVYVYSDGRVADANELSLNGNLIYEPVGSASAENIGVVALSAKRNYERPNEVQVFARLADFGVNPVDADVELWVSPIDPAAPNQNEFRNRGAAVVKLVPERWGEKQRADAQARGIVARDSVEFTLDLTTAATIRVEQKYRDALAADDSAQVVLSPPKAVSVLVVTDGNYYLEKALASLDLKNPKTISPPEYEQNHPADFDVIIFDRAAPKVLPASGNFLYFDCVAPGLKLSQAKQNDQPIFVNDVGVLDWQRDDPILRDLSLGKLYAAEAMQLNVPPESRVLVEGTKGPLVVSHREGRAAHLVVAFDLLKSNWPLRVSFPVFLHNAIQFVALGAQAQALESFQPGATPRIARAELDRAGKNLRSIQLISPAGAKREIPIAIGASEIGLPALDEVGVYRTEPSIPQHERIAVSLLDANESNLLPLDRPPGNVGRAVVVAEEKRARTDLWWWIVACGALPLLMIEWWVYTRRVHL